MSEYQLELQAGDTPPSPGRPKQWLWVGLIAIVVCLMVIAIPAGIARWAYTSIQNNNATATAQALSDGATATAITQIVLPPPGWSHTIDEQFASNRSDWEVGAREFDYGDIYLTMENESYLWRLTGNSEEGAGWWEYHSFDHRLGDFYATTECCFMDGDVADASCGLVFRFLNSDNYYKFVLASDQLMDIALIKNGEWLELADWEYTYLVRPGEINRVAVLAEGTHYRFFVNDQLAYELDDDQLSGGKIGMIASIWNENWAEFQFDNFKVYEP